MDKASVGVIGVGSLGQWHARIYSELEHAELRGVYDASTDRAGEIAERYDCRPYDSIEALAQECDALSIVVPTDLHHDVALPLITAGKHLLIEKPITDSMEDAESLVNAAREQGTILQVGHVERFNPVLSHLEEQLTDPRFIEAIRLAPFPPPREGQLPRGTEVSVVYDLMIHDLEIILHLVRSPLASIHAVGVAVLSPTEDIANARLTFENGCVANLTASRVSQETVRKIRVFQSDTYLSLDYQGQSGQLIRKTPTGIMPQEVPIEKREPLKLELEDFVNCVINHDTPKVTGEHASRALQLASEISRQIQAIG